MTDTSSFKGKGKMAATLGSNNNQEKKERPNNGRAPLVLRGESSATAAARLPPGDRNHAMETTRRSLDDPMQEANVQQSFLFHMAVWAGGDSGDGIELYENEFINTHPIAPTSSSSDSTVDSWPDDFEREHLPEQFPGVDVVRGELPQHRGEVVVFGPRAEIGREPEIIIVQQQAANGGGEMVIWRAPEPQVPVNRRVRRQQNQQHRPQDGTMVEWRPNRVPMPTQGNRGPVIGLGSLLLITLLGGVAINRLVRSGVLRRVFGGGSGSGGNGSGDGNKPFDSDPSPDGPGSAVSYPEIDDSTAIWDIAKVVSILEIAINTPLFWLVALFFWIWGLIKNPSAGFKILMALLSALLALLAGRQLRIPGIPLSFSSGSKGLLDSKYMTIEVIGLLFIFVILAKAGISLMKIEPTPQPPYLIVKTGGQ